MELLQALLPSPNGLQLNDYEMDLEHQHLALSVTSTQTIAPCPLCGSMAHRVHSRYQRTLADLPCLHFSLSLLVKVCKFFCPNPECRRHIFTERIPEVAMPWARKTVRQVQQLQEIGLGAFASRGRPEFNSFTSLGHGGIRYQSVDSPNPISGEGDD